jgi:ring-1,2-phenylacetyl-CoA epoxidase subunit PaaE
MEFGLKPEQIKYELFAGGEFAKQPGKESLLKDGNSQRETELTVTIDGLAHRISASPNQTILETALMHDLDAPFSCKAGVCATCRCRILDGLVDMIANHALEDYEVEQGYRLACQSYPRSKTLKVAFDI